MRGCVVWGDVAGRYNDVVGMTRSWGAIGDMQGAGMRVASQLRSRRRVRSHY